MLCVVAAGCQHPCQGGVDCTGQRGQRGGNRRGRCFKGARQLLGCGALLVLALARGLLWWRCIAVHLYTCPPSFCLCGSRSLSTRKFACGILVWHPLPFFYLQELVHSLAGSNACCEVLHVHTGTACTHCTTSELFGWWSTDTCPLSLLLQRALNGHTYYEFEYTAKNSRYTRHSLAVVVANDGENCTRGSGACRYFTQTTYLTLKQPAAFCTLPT